MMGHLIAYVQEEGRCSELKATEIAYSIMEIVDDMIHDRLEADEDECD